MYFNNFDAHVVCFALTVFLESLYWYSITLTSKPVIFARSFFKILNDNGREKTSDRM